jgi:hypothetical protein
MYRATSNQQQNPVRAARALSGKVQDENTTLAAKAKPATRATATQKQSILPQKRAAGALTDITNNKKPATTASKKAVAPTVSVRKLCHALVCASFC